jgi:light-regulated signal transduction histidine kinase (bacteriophytochrome)
MKTARKFENSQEKIRIKELEMKKEKLTYMIDHDLKGHLQGIMSYLNFVQTSGIKNETSFSE